MAYRVIALCLALSSAVAAQAQPLKPVRLAFTGMSGLTTPFIESMKNAGPEAGVAIEVVPKAQSDLVPRDEQVRIRAGLPIAFAPNEGPNYFLITLAQVGAYANVVVALDRKGEIAASVVGSGPFYATGVRDASARELAKKLAELIR
jgi:hypothetical protein